MPKQIPSKQKTPSTPEKRLPSIPEGIIDALRAAERSGRYMVAIWHLTTPDYQLHLHRTTRDFLVGDIDKGCEMLKKSFEKELSNETHRVKNG